MSLAFKELINEMKYETHYFIDGPFQKHIYNLFKDVDEEIEEEEIEEEEIEEEEIEEEEIEEEEIEEEEIEEEEIEEEEIEEEEIEEEIEEEEIEEEEIEEEEIEEEEIEEEEIEEEEIEEEEIEEEEIEEEEIEEDDFLINEIIKESTDDMELKVNEEITKKSPIILSPYKNSLSPIKLTPPLVNEFMYDLKKKKGLRIILPKNNVKISETKDDEGISKEILKSYKPSDILIKTLQKIDYDKLISGDYKYEELKVLASKLEFKNSDKYEDIQNYILDLLNTYVI